MTDQTDAQRDAAATDAEEAALVPEPTPAERDAIRRMLDADASDDSHTCRFEGHMTGYLDCPICGRPDPVAPYPRLSSRRGSSR